jgi:hypothetical protein
VARRRDPVLRYLFQYPGRAEWRAARGLLTGRRRDRWPLAAVSAEKTVFRVWSVERYLKYTFVGVECSSSPTVPYSRTAIAKRIDSIDL